MFLKLLYKLELIDNDKYAQINVLNKTFHNLLYSLLYYMSDLKYANC